MKLGQSLKMNQTSRKYLVKLRRIVIIVGLPFKIYIETVLYLNLKINVSILKSSSS
jgi:hypothetical protein